MPLIRKKKKEDTESEDMRENALRDVSFTKEAYDALPRAAPKTPVRTEKTPPQGASPSPTEGKANPLRKKFDQFKRRRGIKPVRT